MSQVPVPLANVLHRVGRTTVLLVCGIVASGLYVATDVVAAWRWQDYRIPSQTISELMAVGAPSRTLVVPLFLLHDVLLIAFGVGVWLSARRRALRVTASLLIGVGAVGMVAAPFFPMHLRGVAATLTDTMHIAATSLLSVLIVLAIGFAAGANGRRFRLYSIAMLVIIVAFGAITGLAGPRLAAGQPTPWMGITERISVYGYLLWLAVLSIVLLRGSREPRTSC